MARIINAEHVTRTDMFLVHPAEIVVDYRENTRLYTPDVSDLIESFRKNGQLQPCVVRPISNGMVQLVAGYRRYMAAMALVKEQRESAVPHEDQFRLATVLQKLGPDDALEANISENADRENLSPIENAVAIKRLRDLRGAYGPDGTARVAKVFKKSTTWVTETEELLLLSEKHRRMVHDYFITDGKIGISKTVAQILKDAPEEKRDKILEDATTSLPTLPANNIPAGTSTGSSTKPAKPAKSSSARVKIRDITKASEANGVEPTRKRDTKEWLEFLDGYFDGSEALHPLHPTTQELLKRVRGFHDRKFSETQIDSVLRKIDDCLHAHYVETTSARRAGGR